MKPNDVTSQVSSTVNLILWAVNLALTILAAGVILTAFATFAGFRVPWFKTLGTTELAYAMGALWLYKKA